MLALSAAAGVAVNLGCYSYVPVSQRSAPERVGAVVRVTLTADGTEELARFLGPRVHAVEGSVESVNGNGDPIIEVTWVQLLDGGRQPWMGEGVVTVPQRDIAAVAVHTFDRPRSYTAAAVIAVALATIAYAALQGGGGSPRDTPGDGGPLSARRPAISGFPHHR